MSLKEYRKKRDFSKSGEPKGSKKKGKKIFVVQKHDSSRLHYDFRLAINGVLKSWAVPKGPSLNPKDKRLAIETEDHPLEYEDFEGEIEEGYGKGFVLVWDCGEYKNKSEKDDKKISIEEAYKNGAMKFDLNGEKLKGGFSLINTKFNNDKKNWLLIKERDDFSDGRVDILKRERSVLSGKKLEDFKNEK